MPGKIKVKVLAGRNLPVMDRASETTDAFVEIKFGSVTHKTDVCRKSLNPHWSSTEWYRFEVDESELQDEPLQLRLMDHDTYSANDAIGKVVISLAPLLAREADIVKGYGGPPGGAVLSGWIPVFDTMHGIRGELNVIVKIELFSDFNKYKTSSCGVQFFHCPMIPPGYKATAVHGFVEELVVNDDPEYQWIDKIRTPRASNEARQVAFIKLSNQVQRLVGLKAAELGANAVVGYQQDFDLEGEAGVVARAIGTAVSMVPPPSPSQPLNIPPCTQQQLKKYLDILATDNESITDLNQYFQSHQDELQKLLNIMNPKTPALLDEPENNEDDEPGTLSTLTRQSSIKSYTGSLSIYQDDYVSQKSLKHITEDQTDLNKLLKRNEDSDSDDSGPIQKIKKMKTNFFSRRFGSMRSRKSDKQEKQEDQISLQSNSSDNSRMSLTDIRNEIKRFKRLKKPKFRKTFANKQDEGIGMASILARSVIHAHTSLACIAETQDSEPSPSSTMRRTSESEPTINISDEDNSKTVEIKTEKLNTVPIDKIKVPEIHTSLKNLNTEEANNKNPQRKLSESCPATPLTERSGNLLKLPGETGYFGSLSLSGDSSEVYSSSDEDDESSDQKTDTEKSIETTSSVVQSVLNNGVNKALIANMDRKLSILQAPLPESKSQGTINDSTHQHIFESSKSSPCIREDNSTTNDLLEAVQEPVKVEQSKESINEEHKTAATSNSNKSQHFKFHNPFFHKKVSKSVSAPSSPIENKGFMYRSSKRIRHQLSKLSNSNMMKSISHYSLMPKKKQKPVKIALSQPGSSSDVPSMSPSHETVLGSPFLSFADLQSLDKEGISLYEKPLPISDELEQFTVKMYVGSEPVSRASLSGISTSCKGDNHFDSKQMKTTKIPHKKSSLVHTAVETILMDKVQSLLVPTPEPGHSKEQQFFYDVNQKLEKVEEARNQLNQCKNDWECGVTHMKTPSKSSKNESLFNTAMETILMDKVQALLTPTSPEPYQVKDNPFFPHPTQKDDKSRNKEIHMGKDQPKEKAKDHSSLINTAMKTILMDKVQALIPPSSETLIIEDNKRPDVTNVPKHKDEHENVIKNVMKQDSILHTAMETILLDKVQTLIPPGSDNTSLSNQSSKGSNQETSLMTDTETLGKEQTKREISKNDEQGPDKSNLSKQNLVHTAMETILIDKLQAIIPSTAESIAAENKTQSESIIETEKKLDVQGESKKEVNKTNSMLQAALQTILIDKVESLLSPESEDMNLNVTSDRGSKNEKLIANSSTIDESNKTTLLQKCDTDNTDDSQKMSKEIFANISVPCKMSHSKPVLQHFHPILSGTPLETIPSLPERSLDHTESIDIEGVERTCDCPSECQWQACVSETNIASVCDNSHAACRFDRNDRDKEKFEKDKGSPRHARHESYGGREPVATSMSAQNPSLNSSSAPLGMHRRSSDSDLSVTPKGSSLSASVGNAGSGGGAILRPSMNTNTLEMLEYPFLTMNEYPPGFIIHIGGTVCARSVKLVDAGGESAARAAWWAELRTELRAHARALRCNAVIAYSESAAICEDVCVLSASGTAVVINLECDFNLNLPDSAATSASNGNGCNGTEEEEPEFCSIAHVPYSPGTGPYRVELSTCGGCRRARVPAVLLATCEKPNRLRSYSKAITVTAVAARIRRAPPAAEPGARDISDQLPFLEYELHKLLLAKLRMQGANALFSLQTQIAIGERCVMALASGTAVRLFALPPPTPPRVKASENDKEALEMQKALWDSFTANKTSNGYDIAGSGETVAASSLPDIESEEPLAPTLDLCADKDTCVLELDEAEDVETARSLAVRRNHMQVYSSSLKATPAVAPQAFAQVWRARLPLSAQGSGASTSAERHVQRALDGVTYKLRRLQPCALVAPRFHLELPEDEIQLVVSGTAIPLIDPNKPDNSGDSLSQHSRSPSRSQSPQPSQSTSHGHSNSSGHNASHGNSYGNNNGNSNGSSSNGTADADDDIFVLDEEQVAKSSPPTEVDDKNVIVNGYIPTTVSLTSLSHAAGSRAVRRICALRLLFVRETTAVRELGGLSGFLHTFTCEVLAIARAYTAALGGNMLTSFYLKQLMLQDNAHKNQGQCLLSVGGDVVQITY